MKNVLLIIFSVQMLFAQAVYDSTDIQLCYQKFELAESRELENLEFELIVAEIGKTFLGTDYAANTLSAEGGEQLRINLDGLDCYTFLEASLVFARLIKSSRYSFENFLSELELIRYRGGRLNKYPSRLHYFSDWIFDLDKRKIISDITEEIGGEDYPNLVNFMSSHPSYYLELKNSPEFVDTMAEIEKEISSRKYFYIPQDKIHTAEDQIKSGDLIGITTDIEGLDIAHVGLAIEGKDCRIHFLHSPNKGKKVQITEIPLSDYIKGNKRQTGIIVARPLEP